MGNFTREFTTLYHFDGDTISVTMRRLKRPEAMALAPFIDLESGEISFEDSMQMMDKVSELLPNVIVEFSGLIVEGEEVIYSQGDDQKKLSFLFEEMYFMDLLTRIMTELINSSFLSEDDKKKSKSSVENTSKDSQVSSTLTSVG